ncbi:tyrosine-type recombinase/integrase [Pseudomonas sp. S 311-6]|uniref:tyrosine-type recombinase/integrase n=1 Tax=Kerstersia gyiorum TaxID=206506 RepID=UPI001070D92F|nr:tyrosine-type recombinase/integrase [Kerstersia gyiorum]MCO7641924.1 tyrosine-type recombinase/integrase [Pseudomonas sp. S 311-6]QBR40997.1 integrase [Kerstersia gyiorum]
MGRKPTKNLNLPPRMRARAQRSGRVFYYYDAGGKPRKEIPLGPDMVAAIRQWAELEGERPTGIQLAPTFLEAAQAYIKEVLPTKSPRTQSDNLEELSCLREYFGNPPAPLDQIRPQHIALYKTWRSQKSREWYASKGRQAPPNAGHVRANRDLALFSHIFNHARATGLTDAPNPCLGVPKNTESGRDIYVQDKAFDLVYKHARQPLRDAMDMLYLTGQRPQDIIKMTDQHIRDGAIDVQQGKTGKKLRLMIVGELATLIDRIQARRAQHPITPPCLIVTESGQSLTLRNLQKMFKDARNAAGLAADDSFQLRDLRAKAATDTADASGDIRQAQRQLGHSSLQMTEHYVRNRLGDKVKPTR